MPIGRTFIDIDDDDASGVTSLGSRHKVLVSISDELIAAVEGWRSAHGLTDQSEALGELVRLGLMSEIAKIYRLVTEDRDADERPSDSDAVDHRRDWKNDNGRGPSHPRS